MQASDVRQVYASGTAYSLTNTAATLVFGTTNPTITLTQPGTYLLLARSTVKLNGATFAANRTVTFKLARENNDAADLDGSSTNQITDIVTTQTITYDISIPFVLYMTSNANDIISIQGSVSVVPTAGSIDVTESKIIAIRLF